MQYFKPTELSEAFAILAKYGDTCVPVAGSTFFMGHREELFSDVAAVVNLKHLGLSYIRLQGDQLRIGATTTLSEILEAEITSSGPFRVLAETARKLNIPEVRNAATIAGEVCIAGEVDMPTTLLAYDAQIVIGSIKGSRTMSIHQFHKGYLKNALDPGEIVTEIQVPMPPPGTGGAFHKFERTAADLPLVNVAVRLTLNRDGTCSDIGIAVGAATRGGLPLRVRSAEESLLKSKVDDSAIRKAAALSASVDCVDDFRASAELRSMWIYSAVENALKTAIAHAHEAR